MADDAPPARHQFRYQFLDWRTPEGIIYFVVRPLNLNQSLPEDAEKLPAVMDFYDLNPENVGPRINVDMPTQRKIYLVAQKKSNENDYKYREVGNIGYWFRTKSTESLIMGGTHVGSKKVFNFRAYVPGRRHYETTHWKMTEYSSTDTDTHVSHDRIIICFEFLGPRPTLLLERASNPVVHRVPEFTRVLGASSSNQAPMIRGGPRIGGRSSPYQSGAGIIGRGANAGILGRVIQIQANEGHPSQIARGSSNLAQPNAEALPSTRVFGPSSSNQAPLSRASQMHGGFSGPRIVGPLSSYQSGAGIIGTGAEGDRQIQANEGRPSKIAKGSFNLAPPNAEPSCSFPRQFGDLKILERGIAGMLPEFLGGIRRERPPLGGQGNALIGGSSYLPGSQTAHDCQNSPSMSPQKIEEMINELIGARPPNTNDDGANPDQDSGDNPDGGGMGDRQD